MVKARIGSFTGSSNKTFMHMLQTAPFSIVFDEKPSSSSILNAVILAFRILLFSISQSVPAMYKMEASANTVYQTVNTVSFFLMLAAMCVRAIVSLSVAIYTVCSPTMLPIRSECIPISSFSRFA